MDYSITNADWRINSLTVLQSVISDFDFWKKYHKFEYILELKLVQRLVFSMQIIEDVINYFHTCSSMYYNNSVIM